MSFQTAASINNLPGAVYCVDIGQPKKKQEKENKELYRTKSDITSLPKIAFVSTKKLYQVESS